MGSPSEPSSNGIDASVGALVWVRRRNGSWWPGRIMGVDELSESSLVSPRSGTPVKLLGREDASVDWYNLDKSKRVKAFRCGEYDDCIEKAKAAAANSSKKAVKYARREDAILQALELENASKSKGHSPFFSKTDKSGDEHCLIKEPSTVSHPSKETEHVDEESSSFEDNSNSAQELSQSGVSVEEPHQGCASGEQYVQRRLHRTPNDSEDDGSEGVMRMRGLEDLGVSVASSLKRKRSQVGHVHEFLKRKNRRRTLTKVLESTTLVPVPVFCEELPSRSGSPLATLSDNKVSALESNESKRSFSVVLNNSDSTGVSCENGASFSASRHASDTSLISGKQKKNEISSMSQLPEDDSSENLFDVPFVNEEDHPAGFAHIFTSYSSHALPQVGAGGQSSQSSQVETVSLGNEELIESGSTSSGATDIDSISQRMENGSSKWQSKGKRNSRHTNRNRRLDSRKLVNIDDESNPYLAGSVEKVEPRTIIESRIGECPAWNGSKRSLPLRQSRFMLNPKYQTSDFPIRNCDIDSSLYEVNLEVKASYRPQKHVPYVSLMSKLTGQPITGHPLTVGVLDGGSTDLLVGGLECHLTSSSCEEENMSAFEGIDTDCKNTEPLSLGGGRISIKHLKKHCIFPSKSPKTRKNGLLTKKIRKLSSLTGSCYEKKTLVEKIKSPAIACVPLKVVFSRINASLNGWGRPVNRVMTQGNP
ncbi:hypothetical protein NMG60_11004151 [Bertholletia excelsa]